jgi:Zn finger protein HypA/HybF involved in hydrogenase expression
VFHCERCERSFNATVAAAAGDCPRCKQDDGVASPLRFRLFEPSALKVAGLTPTHAASVAAQAQPAK